MIEFHEAANLFPLLEGAEFEQLKADISENGLLEPIWLHDGKILDGRNRYRACMDLGIGPEYREWKGDDPESFIISMNLHRRHLTREQRRQWVVRLRQKGMSYRAIGEMLGVGEKTAWRDVQNGTVSGDTVPLPDTIVGKDGKVRPAVMPAREASGKLIRGTAGNYRLLNNGIKQCERCQELWATDLDYCPYCHVSQEARVAHTTEKQRAAQAMDATVFSHNSLEYYTPHKYIEAARQVMGGIDLDPASCELAQEWIQATKFYTKGDDGLSKPWTGRVWLNPPYSKTDGRSNQDLWSSRLIQEYRDGNVSQAVLLVKAALGYKWFELLWDDWPVCFARRRLSFVMPDGNNDGQSKQGTAFFYLGSNQEEFKRVFCQFGRIIMPEDQYRAD